MQHRPSTKRGADSRAAILAAAETCFAEEGLRASTRRIADVAGVTQPLVLHYFDSKEALFLAVVDVALERLAARQRAFFADDVDDVDFVLRGLHALIASTLEAPHLLRLVTWARLAGLSSHTTSAGAYWQAVGARLERAQAAGVVRDDIDVVALMLLMDASIKGLAERLDGYAPIVARRPVGSLELSRALLKFVAQGTFTPRNLPLVETRIRELFID